MNLVAIRAHDCGGEAFFDCRITLQPTPGSLTNQSPIPIIVGSTQYVTFPALATLNATIQDDGLPLTGARTSAWSVVTAPSGGTVIFSAPTNSFAVNNDASTFASFSATGTYVLRLIASDSLLTGTNDVTVIVGNFTNQAPVANAGAAQGVLLGTAAILHPTVTDDGLPSGTLDLTWSLISGPGTATFYQVNGTNHAYLCPTGVFVLRLTASDG